MLLGTVLLLGACIIGGDPWHVSAIGNIEGTSAMVRGEVVDKRDGDRFGETVTVRLDADPVDLGSTRVSQTSLELGLGDELEISYSEGNYREGRSYAFFITDTPDDTLGIYGHDLETDEPADEFDDNTGFADVAPIDVLDCLVRSQGNDGELPRLAAAVQAATSSNQLGVLSPELEACEYPDE